MGVAGTQQPLNREDITRQTNSRNAAAFAPSRIIFLMAPRLKPDDIKVATKPPSRSGQANIRSGSLAVKDHSGIRPTPRRERHPSRGVRVARIEIVAGNARRRWLNEEDALEIQSGHR
jgi:hypothetical protein